MVTTVDIGAAHDTLSALADPTRLAILAQLRTRDLCVCHLVERLGLKQSLISHHVGMLRRAGLVESHANPADRRWLYYRLNRAALADVASHLDWLADDGDYDPTPLPCGVESDGDAG
jgi:ArsR family transcriptional regulator